MSTLPFLLSVADELDNINSQSYMDDFGLGFHPHRQFYRTPTIQLSLPAESDWMQADHRPRHQPRSRTYKLYDESPNNLPSPGEGDEEQEEGALSGRPAAGLDAASTSATAAARMHRREYPKSDAEENVDNSVRIYNLSKKCCKDYYRHAASSPHTPCPYRGASGRSGGGHAATAPKERSSGAGYRLHSKCLEGNNSSSEESLQRGSSSIEFLTCFLVKKSRPTKSSSGGGTGGGGGAGGAKKS